MSQVARMAGFTLGGARGASRGWRPSSRLAALIAFGLVFATGATALITFDRGGSAPWLAQAAGGNVAGAYQKLPLSFVPNEGQTDPSVRYYAQGAGFGFYFTDDKAVLSFQRKERGENLQLRFLGASPNVKLEAERQGQAKVNYLKGDDPRRWQTGLPTYGQLAYQSLWPGVDMRFRGSGGRLKYEFALAPGASPQHISLAYAGAESLAVSQGGSLLIKTPLGTLRDSKPHAYQRIGGRKVPVQSRYSLAKGAGGAQSYGFALGAYDRGRPLVIDPGLVYSTFLGGTGTDLGNDIALDGSGSAYVTGRTTSVLFPTTAGAFDTTQNGSDDAFVAKLDPSGSTLVYSTFLGGTGAEESNSIAVDGSGSTYIAGDTTSSAGFPTTPGAFDTTPKGDDAFVAKLDPSGAGLAYSTLLGGTGNDYGNGIALDGTGDAYVTGYTISANFPTTPGAFDTIKSGSFDTYATKVDASGATLDYSTFLGGGDSDTPGEIAVDGSGSAYVAGGTRSTNFPTTAGAFDTTHNGIDDAFVTKLDPAGSALAFSTFLGGTGTDGGGGITVDGAGSAHLTGFTNSSNFPSTPGAFDTTYNSSGDAFVTKLDPAGSALAYSTFLGGTGTDPSGTFYDSGAGILVDEAGSAYVTGRTDSPLFPTTENAFDTGYNGVGDVFLTKLDAAGAALAYSSYLGGTGTDVGNAIALDAGDNAYLAGYTTSSDFPTTAGAFDTTSNGTYDAFVAKLETTSYSHPASAASVSVSLAPVFRQCGPANAPNSEHSPPLGVASCNPPQPTAANARVGATSVGAAQIGVLSGDVALSSQITDVQDTAGNDFDTASPSGDLGGVARLRFTDRNNCTPGPCSGPYRQQATGTDMDFGPIPIDCSPQGSATAAPGSTCSVSTTANTLIPGSVVSGAQSIVQVFRIRILDNSTPATTLFEQQAIFVP